LVYDHLGGFVTSVLLSEIVGESSGEPVFDEAGVFKG
jgi:hypothetical protein